MNKSLFRRRVVPFLLLFALLIAATMIGDLVLHYFGLVWIGRYLGIPGTILITGSMLYSLRKRKVIQFGDPRFLLRAHESLTWLGALMILIHAGVHFNALLPWLATAAMLVNVISGLVGKYLLDKSRRYLKAKSKKYQLSGKTKLEVERELFWDAATFELMAKWRTVHLPISYVFAVLAIGHVISILMFWIWR